MKNMGISIIFTIAALVLMTDIVSAKGVLDQNQWTYTDSHVLSIDPPNGYITFDQSVVAGMTGLLTNVEFYADVTSDRVYFFVNQSGRNDGPHLEATFVTKLAQGSGVYNVDVSAAKIFLKAGDVFSIGLVGAEGTTPAGTFRVAKDAYPDAYPGGALYYRYGSTGWLGLGYDDDMMFRTYVTPQRLYLNDGRFSVEVDWSTATGSGQGTPVQLTPDSGYFWFFGDTNVELLVKILDGRGVNGHFWLFWGAMTDVQYTITVRDSQTGAVKLVQGEQGKQISGNDINAF